MSVALTGVRWVAVFKDDKTGKEYETSGAWEREGGLSLRIAGDRPGTAEWAARLLSVVTGPAGRLLSEVAAENVRDHAAAAPAESP